MKGYAEVYYLKAKQHSLEIHSESPLCNYRLYWTNHVDGKIEVEHFIIESDQAKLVFEMENDFKEPCYFQLQFCDGSQLTCGYRILHIKGMYNFRDLGGFPNKYGQTVKWGKLYRGDQLSNMKEEGISYLEALQLKSIVDFRGEMEYREYPNPIDEMKTIQYHFIPDGQIAAFAGSLQNNEMPSQSNQIENARIQVAKDPNFAHKSMVSQQVQFVNNPGSIAAYSQMLKLMAKAEAAPLYFHCKGGKDRTGYGAMLLLSLLGVDEETIMIDYLLTNRARAEKNQRYLENFRKMAEGDEQIAQFLYSLFDTRAAYLQAAIDEIKSQYASVEEYARVVLQISELEINQLRKLYLN